MVVSIGQSRFSVAPSFGPVAICQPLVTRLGTTSSAAACAGAITPPRMPTAMVGNPSPITPLTKPANTKVAVTKMMRVVLSMSCLWHCRGRLSRPDATAGTVAFPLAAIAGWRIMPV